MGRPRSRAPSFSHGVSQRFPSSKACQGRGAARSARGAYAKALAQTKPGLCSDEPEITHDPGDPTPSRPHEPSATPAVSGLLQLLEISRSSWLLHLSLRYLLSARPLQGGRKQLTCVQWQELILSSQRSLLPQSPSNPLPLDTVTTTSGFLQVAENRINQSCFVWLQVQRLWGFF